MAVLVDETSRVLVQGITGREGRFHTEQMCAYGTHVVAGVTPGKGGCLVGDSQIPVFDSVLQAVQQTGANTSVAFVPAPAAVDAVLEAADAGIELVVCVTEGIPVLDMVRLCAFMAQGETRLIGPNTPGIVSPGRSSVGIMSGSIARPGSVGVVSRSGTLMYEIVHALTSRGLGQSTCIGIGGDPVVGTRFTEILSMFEADPETKQVVLIGEIGGLEEQLAADFIAMSMQKPVTAFVAGRSAPPGTRMGHAGAIIEGDSGAADRKIGALIDAGVRVARYPDEVAELVAQYAKSV